MNINNAENNTNTPRASNSTLSTFFDHVKQHLATTPPVTKFALYIPIIIWIFDQLVSPLAGLGFSLSSCISLHSLSYQTIYQLVLYPFATRSLIQLFIIDIWLLPELYKLEKKQGSLRILWILFTLFTVIPGIIYLVSMATIANSIYYLRTPRGMAGWVVGLVFWSYLEDNGEDQQDRMIAGSIRMPKKMWPVFVFIFFILLAQDGSVFINISAAVIGYLYAKGHLRSLVPSEEKFIEFESKPWLRFLTGSSHFVSIDAAGNSYLPIFMPVPSTNTPIVPSNTNNNSPFPGQGVRLGS